MIVNNDNSLLNVFDLVSVENEIISLNKEFENKNYFFDEIEGFSLFIMQIYLFILILAYIKGETNSYFE